MKRLLSLLLCAAMLMTLGLTSAFAEEADKETQLTELASAVKETLDIDDSYTSFQGDYNDGLRPGWYLYWSKEDGSLSVTCDADGLVTDYSRWNNDRGDMFYGFKASVPAVTLAEAQKTAEEWLGRLLAEEESPRIENHRAALKQDGGFSFTGRILKNGLESPVTFRIFLQADGLQSYYRSDSYRGYVGELPAPEAEVDEAAAAEALAGETVLDIYYVRGENGEARLRYVPVGPRFVVDAQTGEAVDMDALYASMDAWYEEPMAAEASMDAMGKGDGGSGGRALTEVELASIGQYADVLSEETLDETARGLPHMGLEDFRLSRCSYMMDGEEITAELTYGAEMGPDRLFGYSQADYDDYMSWSSTKAIVTKYVRLNAKTGALINVSTSYPLWTDRNAEVSEMGEELAEAFLAAAAPDYFAETTFSEGSSGNGSSSLTYDRLHDGYTYPENYLYVGLNLTTGTVDDYYSLWDEDVTFAASKDIVKWEDALSIYTGAQSVTLGYVSWPEGVDYSDPIYDTYIRWGYSWVESLRLGWYYGSSRLQGVDALTGEIVTDVTAEPLAYDDLEDGPGMDAIRTLAELGIGFPGGSFHPDTALTLRDAVTLLLQAEENDAARWDDDLLRQEALWQGFIGSGGWEPGRELTRLEFVRMLLGASEYGAAAELEGIWAGEYPALSNEDVGYAALAGALGMIAGEDLNESCTRADAASMLYAFMTR